MIEFIKTKKLYIALLAVLFVFVSLSETTYSLFLKSEETDELNYNTGLLDLEFLENEQIVLENVFPMNDSDGVKTKPYTMTIKNTGSIPYLFDLRMIASSGDIDYKYIKAKVNDNLPINLADSNNILDSNLIIYPDEEMTFKIYIWLDINTPNSELGKSFSSKLVTSGNSFYKTLDKSGANHPKLNSDMIPVYYDDIEKVWKKADKSNMNSEYNWYNYDEKKWANSVIIKDSEKQIFDITGRNNLQFNDLTINNGNVVIRDEYLDLNIKYNDNIISNMFRIKFDEVDDNVYLITNGNITYSYSFKNKVFTFRNGNNSVISDMYDISTNSWYIVGYTYDGNKVSFYVNGNKISENNINGNIGNESFKIGTDNKYNEVSKITIGDIMFYDRVLDDNEINNNYKMSFNIIRNGLVSGYSNFTPMTLKEYYLTSSNGIEIENDDVLEWYVWIPRYKYKVWNVLGNEIDTKDIYNNGIDIVFENNKISSGTIYCNKFDCYSDINKTIKVNESDNSKYYTHPAFTNKNGELTGFWVSKYELSDNNESKADNEILTNKNLSDYYEQVKKISDDNNYHVIKNTEWGAIAYLGQSKYGLCSNNKCMNIGKNNTNKSGSDINDSTTLNIYGVFDMSGGADEYTMSNISSDNNLNLLDQDFSNILIDEEDYEIYNEDSFILGDATKELSTNAVLYNWYVRNGLFSYTTDNGIKSNNITTRIITK